MTDAPGSKFSSAGPYSDVPGVQTTLLGRSALLARPAVSNAVVRAHNLLEGPAASRWQWLGDRRSSGRSLQGKLFKAVVLSVYTLGDDKAPS